MKELDIISALQTLESFSCSSPLGIGDDCAVLPLASFGATTELVVSTDLLLENVHFRCQWSSAEQIGHKLMAINLSDIAAMGGRPRFALLNLAIPRHFNQLPKLLAGINKLAVQYAVKVIGGDTCSSHSDLTLGMTIFGEVQLGQAKLRSHAKPGDKLVVSKACGDSGLGFHCLKKGINLEGAISKHLTPTPEVELGIWLGKRTEVNALIDTSDGIATDLRHVLSQSKVGALIYQDSLPLSKELRLNAQQYGLDLLSLTLCAGEDYALLFSVTSSLCDNLLADALRELGRELYVIGEITDKPNQLEILHCGQRSVFMGRGFEHVP